MNMKNLLGWKIYPQHDYYKKFDYLIVGTDDFQYLGLNSKNELYILIFENSKIDVQDYVCKSLETFINMLNTYLKYADTCITINKIKDLKSLMLNIDSSAFINENQYFSVLIEELEYQAEDF